MERTEPSRQGEASGRLGARRCVSWGALHPAIFACLRRASAPISRAIHRLGLSSLCAAGLRRRRKSPRPYPADRRGPCQYDPHHRVDCDGGGNRLAHSAHNPTEGVLAGLCRPHRGRVLGPSLSATWTAMLISRCSAGRPTAYSRRSISRSSLKCCRRAIRRPRHRPARGDRRRPAIDRAHDRRLAHSQPRIRSAFRLRCIDDLDHWRSERS